LAVKFMLDTDVCIYAMGAKSQAIVERLKREAGQVCMSSITLAELAYGAEKSQKAESNLLRLAAFRNLVPAIDFGDDAALHYGTIRAALENVGRPVGPNDLFIAAHARSLELTLVTNNEREFERVPGLGVENWAA
jgi:tRNA(fMet)-specific endonuclease VapC